MGDIQFTLRNLVPPLIRQMKPDLFSAVIQSRAERLLRLRPLIRDTVGLSVFDKISPGLDKIECNAVLTALVAQLFYPFVAARPGAVVILSSAYDLLDLPLLQIPPDIHRADEGRRHDPFVLKRKLKQQGDPFVRPPLILTCHIEENILPSIFPVIRQTGQDPLRALCQEEKLHISPLSHDRPGVVPPRVRLLEKEVGSHAHPDHLPAFHLVPSPAVF